MGCKTDVFGHCLWCGGETTTGGCPTCDTSAVIVEQIRYVPGVGTYECSGPQPDPRDADLARLRSEVERLTGELARVQHAAHVRTPESIDAAPYESLDGERHEDLASAVAASFADLTAKLAASVPESATHDEAVSLVAEGGRAREAWEWLAERPGLRLAPIDHECDDEGKEQPCEWGICDGAICAYNTADTPLAAVLAAMSAEKGEGDGD